MSKRHARKPTEHFGLTYKYLEKIFTVSSHSAHLCQILTHLYLHIHTKINKNWQHISGPLQWRCCDQSHLSDKRNRKEHVSVFIILHILDFHVSSRPGPLFYLLMLTPHSEPVDVHRDGHHNFGVSHRFSWTVVDVAGFDPFPFGPAVLKPNLHLHLAQFKCMCDLGAFSQRKVLFTVKLLFKFEQLLAGESCPSSPALPRGAAGRQRLVRAGFKFALLGQGATVVPVGETLVLAVHGAVLPVAASGVCWL